MLGRPNLPVEVKGLAETLSAMRQFEPDLAKNLNKEIRALMTPVQKKAQAYVPSENPLPHLRNWMLSSSKKKITKETSAFRRGTFPKFNASLVRRGIKIYIGKTKPNNKGFSTFYRLTNITAAGGIMETAGRLNPGGRKTTHEVMLNKRFKPIAFTVHSTKDSGSNNPEAGLEFINGIGGRLQGHEKMRGRLLYRAWNEDEGKTLARVMKALDRTILQFQRRASAQVLRKAA